MSTMTTTSSLRGRRAVTALMAGVVIAVAGGLLGSASPPAGADPPPLTWSRQVTSDAPSARSGAAMAFDASSGEVVLFGGRSASGALLGDTWVYAGGRWTELCASACGPTAATGASMAFDPDLNQLVLFGGQTSIKPAQFTNATWTWNGRQWYRPPTSEQGAPPPRADAAFAVDDAGPTGNVVLFGGTGPATGALSPANSPAANASTTLADTWTWDGSGWSEQRPATSPPARTGAAATWDAAVGAVVLFGGAPTSDLGGWLADTWLWRQNAWTPLLLANAPTPRTDANLDYEGSLGTVVVYGGQTAIGPTNDAWAFAGFGWVPVAAGSPPAARSQAASAWDSATNSLMVFGGSGAGGTVLDDTESLTAAAGGTSPTSAAPGTSSTSPTTSTGPAAAPTSTTTTGVHPTTVAQPSAAPTRRRVRARSPSPPNGSAVADSWHCRDRGSPLAPP